MARMSLVECSLADKNPAKLRSSILGMRCQRPEDYGMRFHENTPPSRSPIVETDMVMVYSCCLSCFVALVVVRGEVVA